MKIEKVIMSCDNSHYQDYWPIVSKVCKKQLGATPVLFKIGETETDFYYDGNGLVKEVKAIPEIQTNIQSLFYRIYGTKFFPDEVCLISDIDMMLLSYDYFQNTIKDFDENSIVVYSSDAYDLERNDSKGWFDSNIFAMCYNAAKGKIFEEVLSLEGSFSDFYDRLKNFKYEKTLEWYGDEVYVTKKIEEFSDKFQVHKLRRGYEEGFFLKDRIEKWHFPVNYVDDHMKSLNTRDGSYDKKLLKEGFYLDCHCVRPFKLYEKEINYVAEIMTREQKLIQTISGQDYSTVNDRCLINDGDIVDIGCLNWDWSEFFIGKKRVIGVDPFENQIEHTELFKGVIGKEDGIIKIKNEGISTSMDNREDGEEVIVKTWKNFCKEFSINKISLLKINIEGAEYDLLDSFDDQDFDNIDQIAISFHDWMNPNWRSKTEKSLRILESKNFDLQKINHSWNWFLATKKNIITRKFEEKKNTPSDINEHLETFKRYAQECESVCEMGVRGIVSTWGFLAGKPKKLTSIDFQDPSIFGGNIEEVKRACLENDIEFEFILGNTLELNIEPCDLLFLDTWHDYQQLRMELYRHHNKVRKYIIFHDTNSFSFRNEDFYELYDLGRPESNLPKGLVPAIDEFVFSNPQWYIYERFANNNGITILKRK